GSACRVPAVGADRQADQRRLSIGGLHASREHHGAGAGHRHARVGTRARVWREPISAALGGGCGQETQAETVPCAASAGAFCRWAHTAFPNTFRARGGEGLIAVQPVAKFKPLCRCILSSSPLVATPSRN